ncbi:hypothetical protein BCR37DRAFT_1992 [Protomyces lactucae-debilis]|uniref:Hexosyltransferase n=1 Tax=Protomyces lactucae-debilis TaxID=2754530 RepID=A0A1Y2FUA6_PROLT|nr:uncharacterized protein BCR37DRAFT_1992 [Protomyces lactucae-debilis]ORY87593.1 hypothetical protein BCR37DRAFT_1992 [Protomyces lactucae-debilis]
MVTLSLSIQSSQGRLCPIINSTASHARLLHYNEEGLHGHLVAARLPDLPPVSLFAGIFSVGDKKEMRNAARKACGNVLASGMMDTRDTVVIRFDVGQNVDAEMMTRLQEQDEVGVLIILGCPENMNEGRHMSQRMRNSDHLSDQGTGKREFDYIMKLDDDDYLSLPNALDWLRP